MVFEKAFGPISPQLKKEFAKHISFDDPNLKEKYEQRNKDMEKKYNICAVANRNKAIWNGSLWGTSPINFTFNDWEPTRRKDPQKAKDLGNKAFVLAREMVNGHINVVLSGNAGVGKTSLALAMLSMLRSSGKSTLFVSVIALNRLVGEQYKFPDKANELYRLRKLMIKTDVLLLDDLGAEAGDIRKVMSSDYQGTRKDLQDLMFDVANQRYEGTKEERKESQKTGKQLIKPVRQTIVTTNNYTEELERIYGQRTISRLITKNKEHRLAFNNMEDMREANGF